MRHRTLLMLGLVLLVAVARLVPHPPNFTPLGAVALFGAAHFRPRWAVFLVPLAGLFVSDVALQVLKGRGFYPGMIVVYGTVALITAGGFVLRGRASARNVAGGTLAASVVFFVVTNFAVWSAGLLYPRTWPGLVACYAAAVPFFHWTLLGDACFATLLFGGLAVVANRQPASQAAAA